MKDFRPISLCNVSYKIVARAIANRLKNILGNIIDPHQSAFIPARAITDNILLGYECMHWLRHSKSKKGYAALKLDMSKAYDRVEWNYLTGVLYRMGFKNKLVNLIMNCVTLMGYSFNINDRIVRNIKLLRGLRQGDPLSPYLFVLCSQGLSAILDHNRIHRGHQGIKVSSTSPIITHLFFTDDSLIFFKATKDNTNLVKDSLQCYEKASGQLIYYNKSAITFGKETSQENTRYIKDTLHLQISQDHELYLGLPTFSTRSKRFQSDT